MLKVKLTHAIDCLILLCFIFILACDKKTTLPPESSLSRQRILLSTSQFNDYNYMKRCFYFLDSYYRDAYFRLMQDGIHGYDAARVIDELKLYVPTIQTDPRAIFGCAAADNSMIFEDNFEYANEHKDAFWRLLEPGVEYKLEPNVGFIQLKSPVVNGMLAVAFRDASDNVYGDVNYTATIDTLSFRSHPIHLKMLKPDTPLPSDISWPLMFRHVYYLGDNDIFKKWDVEINVLYNAPTGKPQSSVTIDGKTISYNTIFGLDLVDDNGQPYPDGKVDANRGLSNDGLGTLEFPSLRPFADPSNPYFIQHPEMMASAIYDTISHSVIIRQSKYLIEAKLYIK
jgi:cell surface protein SprA